MSELTTTDYKKILDYYNQPIPKSTRLLKMQAEKMLANKLCRCIKKFDKQNEARSIGMCTKTVVNNKGFTRGTFKCKHKQTIRLTKRRGTRKRTK